MPFSALIGNDPAKGALLRMIEQKKVPSTLLFYGPEGIGKSLFALNFAALLTGATRFPHPDIHVYQPEGKSSIHLVENIRKLIDEVFLPPYEAAAKVFIIHDAHQMLPHSSNALLKTLEEPSVNSYFILLTSALDMMLPTLVSRSRKVPFFPIAQSLIESFLQEKWGKTPDEARRIAFFSHGSLAKAERLSFKNQFPWRKPLLDILSLDLPSEYPHFLRLAAELEESCVSEASAEEEGSNGSLSQSDAIFEEIVAWYRDVQLLKEGIEPEYLYHLDSLERLKSAVSKPFPPLEKVLDKISTCRLGLQRHIKLRHALEHFFL